MYTGLVPSSDFSTLVFPLFVTSFPLGSCKAVIGGLTLTKQTCTVGLMIPARWEEAFPLLSSTQMLVGLLFPPFGALGLAQFPGILRFGGPSILGR